MRASHDLVRVSTTFDDENLLPHGGLVVAGLLARKLGVAEPVDEHVIPPRKAAANSGAKTLTVIGAALAGGDCIEDVGARCWAA